MCIKYKGLIKHGLITATLLCMQKIVVLNYCTSTNTANNSKQYIANFNISTLILNFPFFVCNHRDISFIKIELSFIFAALNKGMPLPLFGGGIMRIPSLIESAISLRDAQFQLSGKCIP